MTIDQPTSDEPLWGPRRPWGLRETAAAVGVATVIAALGGAAIYAATDTAGSPAFGHVVPGGPPGPRN